MHSFQGHILCKRVCSQIWACFKNTTSRSHSDAQMGNNVPFFLKLAFRPKFDTENEGGDRFLKNSAQTSIMATRKFNMAAFPF